MNEELSALVKDYLRKYPAIPSRRIARWINEGNPQFDVERVRGIVRYYRGANGTRDREHLTDEFLEQPYDLPIASVYDSSDFIIPEKNVLVISDLQIPFHDIIAIKTVIEWAKDYSERHHKIEAILLNGDVMDCYQLSAFSRDPRERNIKEEVEDCKDFLAMLKEEFDVPLYFKFGNHEERFERYLYQHAEELAWLEEFTLEAVLRLKDFNCTVIRDKRIIKVGHLNVVHGHEFRGGIINPVNPARTFFLRAKAPTLGGDRHTTSEHSGRTIDGKLITCWSVGCLCQLKPKYMPINEWNSGFAVVRVEGETFRVLNLRIENGVVY